MELIFIINLVFLGILTLFLVFLSIDEAKREKQEDKGKEVNNREYKEVKVA